MAPRLRCEATNFRKGEQKRRADKLPLRTGRPREGHRVDAPCQLLPHGPGRARPCFRATGRAPGRSSNSKAPAALPTATQGGRARVSACSRWWREVAETTSASPRAPFRICKLMSLDRTGASIALPCWKSSFFHSRFSRRRFSHDAPRVYSRTAGIVSLTRFRYAPYRIAQQTAAMRYMELLCPP